MGASCEDSSTHPRALVSVGLHDLDVPLLAEGVLAVPEDTDSLVAALGPPSLTVDAAGLVGVDAALVPGTVPGVGVVLLRVWGGETRERREEELNKEGRVERDL